MSVTDNTSTAAGANEQSPLDKLYAAAGTAMAALYPDKEKDIKGGRYWKVVELFAADALGEKQLTMFPHRMDDDKLQALLDEHLETLFTGLSQSMQDFYRRKLDETKPSR